MFLRRSAKIMFFVRAKMGKNYLNLTIAGIIFLFFILGCGGSGATSTPPKAPVIVAHGDICKPENNGKDLTTEGFVWTTKSVNCKRTARTTQMCAVELYDNQNHAGKPVTVRFKRGSGSSEMEELPDKFTQNDLKFKTDTGAIVGVGDKLRLYGYAETGGDSDNFKEFGCFINIKKIEKP